MDYQDNSSILLSPELSNNGSMNELYNIVNIICRTTERYLRDVKLFEKGEQLVEGIQNFLAGLLHLKELDSMLLDKDCIVGGITEKMIESVPEFLTKVASGEIILDVPDSANISPQLSGKETPMRNARVDDSFDASSPVIIPKSQPVVVRDSVPITSYKLLISHNIRFQKISDLVIRNGRYLNLKAQVIFVCRTQKEKVALRIWDGTGHKLYTENKYKQLWMCNPEFRKEYYSEPLSVFQSIPQTHFVDIIVYGEHADIAERIKSGDIIAIVNLHVFSTAMSNTATVTLHEGGRDYGREIYLLDDEETEIIKIKNELNYRLDNFKNATEPERMMNSFFEKRRSNENIPPINSARRAAHPEYMNQRIEKTPPLVTLPNHDPPSNDVGLMQIDDDSNMDEIQPIRKSAHDEASPIQHPVIVEKEEARRKKSATPVNVPITSENIRDFFRQRFPSPPRQPSTSQNVMDNDPNIIPLSEGLVLDFLTKQRKLMRNKEVQTMKTIQRHRKLQVEPEIRTVGTMVTGKEYVTSAVQTSPIKVLDSSNSPIKNVHGSPRLRVRPSTSTSRPSESILQISRKKNSPKKNNQIPIKTELLSPRSDRCSRTKPIPPPRSDSLTHDSTNTIPMEQYFEETRRITRNSPRKSSASRKNHQRNETIIEEKFDKRKVKQEIQEDTSTRRLRIHAAKRKPNDEEENNMRARRERNVVNYAGMDGSEEKHVRARKSFSKAANTSIKLEVNQ